MNTLLHTILPAAAVAAIAIAAESCHPTADSAIDFTTRADSVAYLLPEYYGDSAYAAARYSVVWPERIGSADFSELADTLTRLTFGSNGGFDSAASQFLNRPLTAMTGDTLSYQAAPFADAQEATLASLAVVESEVSLLTPALLVIDINSWGYMAHDAHGMQTRRFVNYDIDGHRLLSAADVFTPGSESAVSALIENVARHKYTEAALFPDAVFTPSVFRFTDAGLEFVFQPYEVGPYSSGIITVPIPTAAISPHLTPQAAKLLTTE